jgi:hypothetical protein
MDFSMLRIGSGGTASSPNTEIAEDTEVAENNGVLEFL